jgi:hypothetical protein
MSVTQGTKNAEPCCGRVPIIARPSRPCNIPISERCRRSLARSQRTDLVAGEQLDRRASARSKYTQSSLFPYCCCGRAGCASECEIRSNHSSPTAGYLSRICDNAARPHGGRRPRATAEGAGGVQPSSPQTAPPASVGANTGHRKGHPERASAGGLEPPERIESARLSCRWPGRGLRPLPGARYVATRQGT